MTWLAIVAIHTAENELSDEGLYGRCTEVVAPRRGANTTEWSILAAFARFKKVDILMARKVAPSKHLHRREAPRPASKKQSGKPIFSMQPMRVSASLVSLSGAVVSIMFSLFPIVVFHRK